MVGIGLTVIYRTINGENLKRGNTTEKQGGSNVASTSQNGRYPNWFSGTSLIHWVRKHDAGSSPVLPTPISGQNYLFLRVLAGYKININFPNVLILITYGKLLQMQKYRWKLISSILVAVVEIASNVGSNPIFCTLLFWGSLSGI